MAGFQCDFLIFCLPSTYSTIHLLKLLLFDFNYKIYANMAPGKGICKHVRTTPKLGMGCESTPHVAYLLQDTHLGVLTSTMLLLIRLASCHTEDYEFLFPFVINVFGILVLKRACAREHLYYRTPSLWLQIKLLKFLQLYPNVMMEGNQKSSSAAEQTRDTVANFIEERRLILSFCKKDEIKRVYAFGSYIGREAKQCSQY